MKRRPGRRAPTSDELFMASAFFVLAMSIAWGAWIRLGVSAGPDDGVVKVHFPADHEVAPVNVRVDADDQRGAGVAGGRVVRPAAPQVSARAGARRIEPDNGKPVRSRSWGTALWDR